jgi:hypothetical protein
MRSADFFPGRKLTGGRALWACTILNASLPAPWFSVVCHNYLLRHNAIQNILKVANMWRASLSHTAEEFLNTLQAQKKNGVFAVRMKLPLFLKRHVFHVNFQFHVGTYTPPQKTVFF